MASQMDTVISEISIPDDIQQAVHNGDFLADQSLRGQPAAKVLTDITLGNLYYKVYTDNSGAKTLLISKASGGTSSNSGGSVRTTASVRAIPTPQRQALIKRLHDLKAELRTNLSVIAVRGNQEMLLQATDKKTNRHLRLYARARRLVLNGTYRRFGSKMRPYFRRLNAVPLADTLKTIGVVKTVQKLIEHPSLPVVAFYYKLRTDTETLRATLFYKCNRGDSRLEIDGFKITGKPMQSRGRSASAVPKRSRKKARAPSTRRK